ncbi:MAG: hypothetical protein AAF363_18015 [Bacteroidota bacterium]
MVSKIPDSILNRINTKEEEIILNGPPGLLTGTVNLKNQNKDVARVRYLDLKATRDRKSKSLDSKQLYFNSKLRAGEESMEHISLSLAPDTAPGTYENYIELGGKKRKVVTVIQPTIAIEITPSDFSFQGTKPGTEHLATITVTNMGNMDFQIPQVKHVAPMDMDLLCRAFGYGFRQDMEEGFSKTMDHVTRNLKENLPKWAKAKVAEAGRILKPGRNMLVNIKITIPPDAKADNDYDLLIRFWDKDLNMIFKSHQTN